MCCSQTDSSKYTFIEGAVISQVSQTERSASLISLSGHCWSAARSATCSCKSRRRSPGPGRQSRTPVWWSRRQTGTRFCCSRELHLSHWPPPVEPSSPCPSSRCSSCQVGLSPSGCRRRPTYGWRVRGFGSRAPSWAQVSRKCCCSSLRGRWWVWWSWAGRWRRCGSCLTVREQWSEGVYVHVQS